MWTYMFGPFLSLLPERWRARIAGDMPVNWPRAALLSGALETGACLAALIAWYFYWMNRTVLAQMDVTIQATKGAPGEGAAYGMGAVGLISLAIHPLTWALGYFSIEGAVRLLAALHDEAAATLPLTLVDAVLRAATHREREARTPRLADEVTRGPAGASWDLRIASCRPKPHWRHPLTIAYQGEIFQVIGEVPARSTPARSHVYLLRRLGPTEVVRGIEQYDPEGVLHAEKAPGFWGIVFREVHEKQRRWRLPRVPDEIRFYQRDGETVLEITASRPKDGWTPPRVVRFGEHYYRLETAGYQRPPRPYIYHLRRLAAGAPGRNVLLYVPEPPSTR